jgi:molybdopterin converting factor small subunit
MRAALVAQGVCDPAHPPVTVELYGGLRMRGGRAQVPLHADTIRRAVQVLRRALPQLTRVLPDGDEVRAHVRFSVNGQRVTDDLDLPLRAGDRLVVFSASVGG